MLSKFSRSGRRCPLGLGAVTVDGLYPSALGVQPARIAGTSIGSWSELRSPGTMLTVLKNIKIIC